MLKRGLLNDVYLACDECIELGLRVTDDDPLNLVHVHHFAAGGAVSWLCAGFVFVVFGVDHALAGLKVCWVKFERA